MHYNTLISKVKTADKSKLAGTALFVAVGLMGVAAYAQDAKPPKPHGPFDIAQFDTDKDGKVSKAEMESARAARVKAIDANGDGKLSAEEMATPKIAEATKRISERSAEMVKRMDSDGDGLLSVAELAVRPGPERLFDRVDANSDGFVTQDEVDGAMKAMHDRKGEGRGKHGKHRPPMEDDMGGPDGTDGPDGDDPAN